MQREERDTYVESVSENYYKDEDLAAMVQEGLDARIRKRRRTGKHDKEDDQGEQSKEMIFEGDFPIMCVNGDVDVTGCLTTNQSSGLEDTAAASIDCYRCLGISPLAQQLYLD